MLPQLQSNYPQTQITKIKLELQGVGRLKICNLCLELDLIAWMLLEVQSLLNAVANASFYTISLICIRCSCWESKYSRLNSIFQHECCLPQGVSNHASIPNESVIHGIEPCFGTRNPSFKILLTPTVKTFNSKISVGDLGWYRTMLRYQLNLWYMVSNHASKHLIHHLKYN